MGNIVKILVFVVGALGLLLTGLNGAESLNVDTDPLLASMGETPGDIATSAKDSFGGALDQFGTMLADWTGAEADAGDPSAVQKYGPEGIAAIISAMMMMFSTRRSS